MATRGIRLDFRLVANRMSQLMRLLVDQGSLSDAQTMMTLIVSNIDDIDTYVQAAADIGDLPTEQTIPGSSADELL